jgi:hypothetical protein
MSSPEGTAEHMSHPFSRPFGTTQVGLGLPRTTSWAKVSRPFGTGRIWAWAAQDANHPTSYPADHTLIALKERNRLHVEGLWKQINKIHLLH